MNVVSTVNRNDKVPTAMEDHHAIFTNWEDFSKHVDV